MIHVINRCWLLNGRYGGRLDSAVASQKEVMCLRPMWGTFFVKFLYVLLCLRGFFPGAPPTVQRHATRLIGDTEFYHQDLDTFLLHCMPHA